MKLVTDQDIDGSTILKAPRFIGPHHRLYYQQSNRAASILCLVLTTVNAADKVKAINDTWAKRCNKTLFFSDKPVDLPNVVYLDSVKVGRLHLTEKVVKAFLFVHIHYSSYDWFLKADDDTYMILENLRVLLSYFNPKKPVYLGQNFKYATKQGFNSGGAGYVISREALDRFSFGVKKGTCHTDGKDEDVDIGKCLDVNGVVTYDTTDKFHRETFHAGKIEDHVVGSNSPLLLKYPTVKAKHGFECCSSLSISFHYVQPAFMYVLDMLLYHLTVYDRNYNNSRHVYE